MWYQGRRGRFILSTPECRVWPCHFPTSCLGLSLSSSGVWSWSDSLGGVVTMEWSNTGFYQISDVIMTYPYFYAIKKEEMLPE